MCTIAPDAGRGAVSRRTADESLRTHGAIVGIRAEHIRVVTDGTLRGRVARRETTGADAYLEVATERGSLIVRVAASNGVRSGDCIALDLPAAWLRRFDAATGQAIA